MTRCPPTLQRCKVIGVDTCGVGSGRCQQSRERFITLIRAASAGEPLPPRWSLVPPSRVLVGSKFVRRKWNEGGWRRRTRRRENYAALWKLRAADWPGAAGAARERPSQASGRPTSTSPLRIISISPSPTPAQLLLCAPSAHAEIHTHSQCPSGQTPRVLPPSTTASSPGTSAPPTRPTSLPSAPSTPLSRTSTASA